MLRRIRAYFAVSLDGYLATADGSVDWLSRYDSHQLGYDEFLAQIGTVVMGRKTYQQLIEWNVPWPYTGKECWVFSTKPQQQQPPPASVPIQWRSAPSSQELLALADELRSSTTLPKGDVWLIGGSILFGQFLRENLVDELDLFWMPQLLGRGIPLFPQSDRTHQLRLHHTQSYPQYGVVRTIHRISTAADEEQKEQEGEAQTQNNE